MSDRIIRDEIWMSDRFLDLPTDVARVAFMRFISLADDFGNLEGGMKRLFRILEVCTQAKTMTAVEGAIDSLLQADLIRRYTVDDRELFHIPRFHVHKQYVARKVPASPWCDKNAPLGKESRGRKAVTVVPNQGLASRKTPERSNHVVTTSQPRSNLVVHGVGVGVGEEIETLSTESLVVEASPRTTYRPPDCPSAKIVELYHETLASLPSVEVLGEHRKRAIAARWREACADGKFDRSQALEWFGWFFQRVAKSEFLMGRVTGKSGRTWKANIDFLMSQRGFVGVIEGKYIGG